MQVFASVLIAYKVNYVLLFENQIFVFLAP